MKKESVMSLRVRAANTSEVPSETGLELVLEGKIIALYQVDGQFCAMDGICPHAGGPLASGRLTNGIVTCPWHGWQFDVQRGEHCLNPQICQRTYAVEIEGEEIFVIFSEA